jgi:hypothetical protein
MSFCIFFWFNAYATSCFLWFWSIRAHYLVDFNCFLSVLHFAFCFSVGVSPSFASGSHLIHVHSHVFLHIFLIRCVCNVLFLMVLINPRSVSCCFWLGFNPFAVILFQALLNVFPIESLIFLFQMLISMLILFLDLWFLFLSWFYDCNLILFSKSVHMHCHVQSLRRDEVELEKASRARRPRAVVLCPTRELAEQVWWYESLCLFVQIVCVYIYKLRIFHNCERFSHLSTFVWHFLFDYRKLLFMRYIEINVVW